VKLGPPGPARTGAVPGAVDARAGAEMEKAVGVGVGVGVGVTGAAGIEATPPPPPPQAETLIASAIDDAMRKLRLSLMLSSFLFPVCRGLSDRL
jgi:hypothetical protein